MKYQVFSCNEWLYPDIRVDGNGQKKVILHTARGAFAACQILFNDASSGEPIKWKQRNSGNTGFDLQNPELYQLIDVEVSENTGPKAHTVEEGETAGDYITRKAPFRVYDVMKPLENGCLTRSSTEALYLCWKIPFDAQPGRYESELTIELGNDTCVLQVDIEVYPARLPEKETLAVTNWFNISYMANRHGLEMWSEEHWEMIRKYARLMRRAHQNHFLLRMNLVDIEKTGENRYSFDFNRVERLIRLFFDEGFTCIDGGHVGTRVEFEDADFVLTCNRSVNAIGAEGYAFLAQYLTAWHDFLSKKGWLDKIVQHIADEPMENSANNYRVLAGIVRKFMPGVPLIDAVGLPDLYGSIDIWVPTNEIYQEHMERFEELRNLGDTLWFYTCCNPGGHYCNRLMDIPLLKSRYLHWGNYKYNLKGYLHWGLNSYKPYQNPFESTCPVHNHHGRRLPSGDTHIVYPGTDGPWGSVRLEAMRAGAEDYELLRLLEKSNKALADKIAGSCMTSFTQVELNTDKFDEAHRKLLQAVSAASVM